MNHLKFPLEKSCGTLYQMNLVKTFIILETRKVIIEVNIVIFIYSIDLWAGKELGKWNVFGSFNKVYWQLSNWEIGGHILVVLFTF